MEILNIKKIINYNLFSFFSKKLKIGTYRIGGQNFTGKICIHHRSGGTKRNYCFIDFFRRINAFGTIFKIIKDVNRTAFIGAIIYDNGLFSNIILTEGLKKGDRIYSGSLNNLQAQFINGFAIPIYSINLFTLINNIESYPYIGASFSRAAGCSSILVGKKKDKIILKFKSGWNIYLSKFCIATLGSVSNILHRFSKLKKAGIVINLGKRPHVRGVAMNPCDHPHGGGEGKKSKPSSPRSPWGWLTTGTSSIRKKYQKIKKKKYKILR